MQNVTLNFNPEHQNGDVVAIAEVTAQSENEATSLLQEYLEENYPEYAYNPDAHFEEDGKFYFKVIE